MFLHVPFVLSTLMISPAVLLCDTQKVSFEIQLFFVTNVFLGINLFVGPKYVLNRLAIRLNLSNLLLSPQKCL